MSSDAERVTGALESLRSAVAQRRSDLAGAETTEALRATLRDLRDLALVPEPRMPAERSLLGTLRARARRAAFRALFRWHARAVWKQQSAFNELAVRMLQDLVENDADRAAEIARQRRRIEDLERP